MSAYIFCVDSTSGLPIFSRKKGIIDNLPFSVKGSLNGVHMYGKALNIEMLRTLTEDYCVSWKECEERIILIGISTGCSEDILEKVLSAIFSSMVLVVGIEEINNQRNIERLKRELKLCYPLIDRLMDSLDYGGTNNKYYSDIIGLVEAVLCQENHLLQILLDSYVECVDSIYSCLLIHGKIAVATESWWSLHPEEIKLLSLLATPEVGNASTIDVPIFLPHKSPTVAFRFVAYSLIPNVQVCSLCGSSPSLVEIERLASQCFLPATDVLTRALQIHPRNFPSSCQIDGRILGLLLINLSDNKYMISKNVQQNTTKKLASSSHRLDILRTFYYQAVNSFLLYKDKNSNKKSDRKNKNQKEKEKTVDNDSTIGKETYWCSEYHKCHALVAEDNILCVLYNSTIPTHSLRTITAKTLKSLISDKQLAW